MPVFSIIGEGLTDHAVLKNILIGYWNDEEEDEISFRFNQPLYDETDANNNDASENFGGWYKVLEYCESEVFRNGSEFFDYIIIQIDTDTTHEKAFGVNFNDDLAAYIDAIKSRLIESIGQEFYPNIQNKTFFAISVKAMECWLLPIRYDRKDVGKTGRIDNCFRLVEESIQGKLHKTRDNYLKLSKDYRKTKKLRQLYDKNLSLKIFIDSLDNHFAPTAP
jgi:hypothetical protein